MSDNRAATEIDVSLSSNAPTSQRACIVRYDDHPGDSRVENQAQALRESGFSVDILCMRTKGRAFTEISDGIRIIRVPALSRLRGNILLYAAEYGVFWFFCFLALSVLQARRKYTLVQVCNLPDFLVFSALIPKLCGAKILLDFRENMVEMYAAKFDLLPDSRWLWLLAKIEQSCVRFADLTVTCTDQMRQATINRGTPANKIFVMLNSVNPKLFYEGQFPDPTLPVGSRFNIITHGSIIPRYGHETLLRAVALLRQDAPEVRLAILGDGQIKAELEMVAQTLEINDIVRFYGHIPFREMMMHLRNADVGAVTMVRNMETDLIHTIKMQEYMILGLPVVISRTNAVEGYFDERTVQFFEAGNQSDLAAAFLRLRNNPALRLQLARNARTQCEHYNAADQKQAFAERVRELVSESTKERVPA